MAARLKGRTLRNAHELASLRAEPLRQPDGERARIHPTNYCSRGRLQPLCQIMVRHVPAS